MEYNKENNAVPSFKASSDPGSDLKALSRNQIFAENLKKQRTSLGYTQQKISDLTGIGLKAIQNYESGSWPKGDYAIALAEALECSIDWLFTNKGPDPDSPGEKNHINKKEPLYNKVETPPPQVASPDGEYGADADDFGKAVSGLKEIFDSRDPVLIPAIQANIHAFQISVRRERQIQQQNHKINKLEKECEGLKERITALEKGLEKSLAETSAAPVQRKQGAAA